MKKVLFIAAAVAIVASCAKVTTVRTADPEEIAVKAVANAAVKAPIEDEILPTDGTYKMWVHALFNNKVYFDDVEFVHNTGTGADATWKGSTAQYWPAAGKVTFNAISAPDGVLSVHDFTTDGTTVSAVTATLNDNSSKQAEVLVSHTVESAKVASVPMTFEHALAQVVVKMGRDENAPKITVSSVKLVGTYQKGDLSAVPASDDVTFTWTPSGGKKEFTLCSASTEVPVTPTGNATDFGAAPTLVVPVTAVDQYIEITYSTTEPQIDNAVVTVPLKVEAEPDSGETSVTAWEAGKKYIYTITFGAQQEILINPSVEEWAETPVSVAQ